MEHAYEALTQVAEYIDLIGIAIVLIGAAKFLIMYGTIEVHRLMGGSCVAALQDARRVLGTYILIALEFMITSDIIISVVVRTLDSLAYLAGIVFLRTLIGYFLERELQGDDEPVADN